MIRIGLDLDGCFSDFNTRLLQELNKHTGMSKEFPLGEPSMWWYPTEELGFTQGQLDEVLDYIQANPGWWAWLPRYPFTFDVLHELATLQKNGKVEVYFITARPGDIEGPTTEWLRQNGFSVNTRNNTPIRIIQSDRKGLVAAGLRLMFFIEDNTDNALDILTTTSQYADCGTIGTVGRLDKLDKHATPTMVLLIDHLYNRDARLDNHPNLERLNNVGQALPYILGAIYA